MRKSGQMRSLDKPKVNRQYQQHGSPHIPRYLELLTIQLTGLHLPLPVCEFYFHKTRRWKFDFAWVEEKVALEVAGGLFVSGGHTRGSGYWKDLLRGNEATLLGWRVFTVTPSMLELEDGRAALLLERALKQAERPE